MFARPAHLSNLRPRFVGAAFSPLPLDPVLPFNSNTLNREQSFAYVISIGRSDSPSESRIRPGRNRQMLLNDFELQRVSDSRITGSLKFYFGVVNRIQEDFAETDKASGNDVVDFAISKQIKSRLKLNLAIDNLLNKKFFETQNSFESRRAQAVKWRTEFHATPGHPFSVSIGVTFTFGAKNRLISECIPAAFLSLIFRRDADSRVAQFSAPCGFW